MMFYLAASASEKIDRIIGDFGVEWPMLIAQAVNFTLVAFVIYKFGFKGILSTIKEREKQISDSLKHAETIKIVFNISIEFECVAEMCFIRFAASSSSASTASDQMTPCELFTKASNLDAETHIGAFEKYSLIDFEDAMPILMHRRAAADPGVK